MNAFLRRVAGVGLLAVLVHPASLRADDVPAPYRRAVELIQGHYMYPDGVTPEVLVAAAANSLERAIDWLYADVAGGVVTLRHAEGREIGSVTVTGWADLPDALWQMQAAIERAGMDFGDSDLRLTLLAGLTTELDNYSRMLAGDKLESFDTRLKGTLTGIGASMRRDGEKIVITELVPDGPATRGGLRVGDVVLRIDGFATTNLPLKEATRRIRGAAGSKVTLDVERAGKPVSLVLTRENIVIDNVSHQVLEGDVGYVRIDNVSQQTMRNLQAALAALQGRGALAHGLVLDLRGNTGGSMKESGAVVDALVRGGVLLTTVGRDGRPLTDLIARMEARDDGQEPDVPVVVLVDSKTASGAEIISGSLQELGRSVLIGERTFGKGQVQKIYTLDQGLSFKMTVAEYLLANDRPVAGVGVQPDLHVGHYTIGEDAIHLDGWDVARELVGWGEIVPAVHLPPGPPGEGEVSIDVTRELARRALLRAAGADRAALLTAVQSAGEELRGEQTARLAAAMQARELDWTPAPEEGAAPEVRVTLTAEPTAEDPDVYEVRAVLRNDGPTPLFQAMVRTACETFDPWDDLMLPFGRVPSGEVAVASARVRLPRGIELREDAVGLEVDADRRASTVVADRLLRASTALKPPLRVVSHLEPQGQEWVAVIDVTNRSEEAIEGLEAWFEAPWNKSIELVDVAARVERVDPGGTAQIRLRVKIHDDDPGEVPLELVIESDAYGTLFRPELMLHASGREVTRQAPVILPDRHPLSARPGRFSLGFDVVDDGMLESVVVFANDDKILWHGAIGERLHLRPSFDVVPGPNIVTVVAVDRDGNRVQKTLRVLGLDASPPPARRGGAGDDGDAAVDRGERPRVRPG